METKALAGIMGGMLASVLPNLLFAWVYFAWITKAKPPRFMKFLYLCESLKFVSMALLVIACLIWPGLQLESFFAAFMIFELARLLYFFKLLGTASE